jgi:hypothetical protein
MERPVACPSHDRPALFAKVEIGAETAFIVTPQDWREEAIEGAKASIGPARRGSVEPREQATMTEGTASLLYSARREGSNTLLDTREL